MWPFIKHVLETTDVVQYIAYRVSCNILHIVCILNLTSTYDLCDD